MGLSFKDTKEYKEYAIACEYYRKEQSDGNLMLYYQAFQNAIYLAQKSYKNIGWNGKNYDWQLD